MQNIVSIIIPTMQRAHLLKWNLYSLAKQNISVPFETIVLNDGIPDETEAVCAEYAKRLNLKYVFTGQRNSDGISKWRVPGFAVNIGVQLSNGEVLIICCAEMYHLDDTITPLSTPLFENSKLIGIPTGFNDQDRSFLKHIEQHDGDYDMDLQDIQNSYTRLIIGLPYLMAISRKEFFAIGGYDEDFIGIAAEDDDLVKRLLKNDCNYITVNAHTIHLYHDHVYPNNEGGWQLNQNLYRSRMGQIVRNQGREWGKLGN